MARQTQAKTRVAGSASEGEAEVRPRASAPDDDGLVERLRQHEVVFNMTTQMLAMHAIEDRLILALDTITAELGYACAAVGLLDVENGTVRIRMAAGFSDDAAVESIEVPLDSSLAHLEGIHTGKPGFILRNSGTNEAGFLERFGAAGDLLALPLFGGPHLSQRESGLSRRGYSSLQQKNHRSSLLNEIKFWVPEAKCLGILYIGVDRDKIDDYTVDLLSRFADRIGAVIAVGTRIEEMDQSISQLRLERQWVESVMESVADPIVLTNLDNEILLQNQRAEELFSGSEEASEGKRRALKMNDLLFSAYLSSATVSSSDSVGRDLTLVDPIEGSDVHFEVVSTSALNMQGEVIGLVSVFRDVTDLRLANEELIWNYNKIQQAEADARRERDRLNLIIENVGHPVVVTDAAGNFILFNRRAETLFRQEAVTKAGSDLLFRSPDDPYSAILAAVRANSVKLTSFISGLASETRTGRKAEIDLTDPQTREIFPMEITSVEVLDPTGQVTAVVSVLHDLSELRELERRRLEQQLSESDKLAAVGTLAASIAHEVNNPLEAIKNSLFLLQGDNDEPSRNRFLDIAFKEMERVSHIIRQMLGFARRSGGVEWLDINRLLEETLALVGNKLQHSGIRVVRDFEPDLPDVHAFPDQLRQVLLNLILNAQQSIERAGRITIKTFRYDGAVQPAVRIEISDTGRGIGEDDLKRIFEPFFTTRKDGTGLGLWVTQNIIRQHGGRLDVKSTVSRGTTFQITLPIDSPPLKTEGAASVNR
jgi:PAS domain S-box-containing protein